MKPFFAFTLVFAAAVALPMHAAQLTSTDELVGHDRRREVQALRKGTAQAAKSPRPAQAQAMGQLKARAKGASVDLDPFLGSPKWIYSPTDTLTGPNGRGKAVSSAVADRYQGDEHRTIKAFVDEHRSLFGHGPELLKPEAKTRDHVDKTTRVRTTAWQQRVDEIPVYESIFITHVSRAGELMSVSSLFVPDPERAADKGTPRRADVIRSLPISAKRAIEISAPVIGEQADEILEGDEKPKGATRSQRFRVKPLPGDADAELTWFAEDGDTLRLCWQVELTRRRLNERFRVLVDARTGEVLLWRKLTVEVQPVTYKVITNDSPMPLRPGWSAPSAERPARVEPSRVTISSLSSNGSPVGWIHDGEMTLRGNNVEARLDRDGDDRADMPRVMASLDPDGRVFDFPMETALHPTNYSQAAAVQLFYWCNWAHDRLYDIGFVEIKGNFQKDNFARGGFGDDPVIADAQDGSGVNNANFTPTRDGTPARIQMFLFSGPNPPHDGTLDVEVVLHEYVHGMSDRRVGHGIGISQLQTYGMAEGWSDFFAEAMLTRHEHDIDGNYPMGGYAAYLLNGLQESWYYGIRRYPYSTSTNVSPLMFQDIDPVQAGAYPGIPRSPVASGTGAEVHRQGEVWGLMLWELRAEMLRRMQPTPETYNAANDFIMRMVADGMDWCPPNPTFVQARDGILAADRALTGGTNALPIWTAFAKRGLGLGAVANDVTTTVGIVGSKAIPSFPAVAVSPVNLSFNGAFGGMFVPEAGTFNIANQTTDTITWSLSNAPAWLSISQTNGILLPQASTNVVVTTNGFEVLPVGLTNVILVCRTSASTNAINLSVSVNVGQPADSLDVEPDTVFETSGPVGGPFTPTNRVYTLEASDAVAWYVTNVPPWLTVVPTNGVLDFGEKVEVTATLNSAVALQPPGLQAVTLSFVNKNSGRRVDAPVTLRIGREDFLVEDFETRPLDLSWSTLTLTPFDDDYVACMAPASEFPSAFTNATVITDVGDDTYHFITLSGGATVPFFGVRTNGFWISANGNVTPDPGFNTGYYVAGQEEFFARVRVAPYYMDLNPAAAGTVSWEQLSDRVVVTWKDVPQFGTVSTNNVQLELFFDGQIRMTWLQLELPQPTGYPVGIVGLSRGTGIPPNFVASDLSSSSDCAPTARLVLPALVKEGDTNVKGTLFLSGMLTNAVVATLRLDNTNEIVVPSTIVIPPGKTSVEVPITVVDDLLLDGPQLTLVTVEFPDRAPTATGITVGDNEHARITVGVPVRGTEGDGVVANAGYVFLGELPVGEPAGQNLVVQLASSKPSRVAVPAAVIVPQGATMAFFEITYADDELLNGSEQVTITASVAGWEGDDDADAITVRDNESYALALSVLGPVTESGGLVSIAGYVSIAGTAVQPVVVNFTSERPDAIRVTGPVVIGSALRSNSFSLTVSNNTIINPYDSVRITATATNFTNATVEVTVLDDDRPTSPRNPQPDGETHVSAMPLLAWGVDPLPDITSPMRFHVYLDTTPNPTTLIGVTTNSVPLLQVTSQLLGGTTYYWRVVASNGGFTASSPVWSFSTAGFDHFDVEPVLSPQVLGEPFDVVVTARDEYGQALLNYNGVATLTNRAPESGGGTIAITEIDTSDLDRVEFQNVTDRSINIGGWEIICYDWTSWPEAKVVFTIPGPAECKPGEVFQLRTLIPRLAPGTYPNFIFTTNLFWNHNATNNQIAVMLRDSFGEIVDFVCAADATPSLIENPRRVPRTAWDGAAVPVNLVSTLSYQRRGNADNNDASDWSVGLKSVGTNNVGFATPFTNFFTASMVAPPATSFSLGSAIVTVTVFDEVRGMLLLAADSLGRTGGGAAVDVLANDDISVSMLVPNTVTVHDSMQCRITVTNSGAGPATGVWLTNIPPAFTEVSSATASQGVCAVTNGQVVCNLGTIPGESAVSVVVVGTPTAPGSITNKAIVARANEDRYEPNNTVHAVTLAALPQLTILDSTNSEPFSNVPVLMAFNVRLSVPSAVTTSVEFATSEGMALAGSDYVMTNGIITFPPGMTNQSIGVLLIPDGLSESNETFFVHLLNPSNAQVTRSMAVATISDNDGFPAVAVQDTSVTEGATNSAAFRITLSTNSGRVISVGYYTTNASAVAGLDYEPVYGTAVFPPGVTTQTISVPVYDDSTWEPMKTFALVLSNPGNGVITRMQGLCTLSDDDTNDVHHLAFDQVPQRPLVKLPFEVSGSARDVADRVVTNFNGPVFFTATGNETTRTVGTNSTTWNFPFSASYHDARTEVLYLASELGAAGQITSLSLDITNMPGQALRNFTIRMQPTLASNVFLPLWSSGGWVTNFRHDVTVLSTGWVTFTFQQPYVFDGSNNVIVDFSFDNESYSSDGLCRVSRTTLLRSLAARSDSAFGDPLTWTNTTAGVTTSSNVPNARFTIGDRIAVTPNVTSNAVNGFWNATLTLDQESTNVTLRAVDEAGHFAVYSGWSLIPDSDGDGLPDWWEIVHGFDPDMPGDQFADLDGDGLSNGQEFLAGTEPRDAASTFKIIAADLGESGIMRISVNSVEGRRYSLDRADSLGNWKPSNDAPTIGTGGMIYLYDRPEGARYYRVRIVP